MDSDPNRNVADLSGKSDSVPAPRETAPTPAVTRPGAGPSCAMVTRSRARGGKEISVEPEMEFRPEIEFHPEVEIPAETCDEGFGAARPTTDTASQYTLADKPEVTVSYTSQEVTTSLTTPETRSLRVHICMRQTRDTTFSVPCQTLPFIHLCILQLPKPICLSTGSN